MAYFRLNFEDVLAIRFQYAEGGVTMAELASEFDVSIATISRIIRRTTWKNAEEVWDENKTN